MEEIQEVVCIRNIEVCEKSFSFSQIRSIEDILYMDNRELDKCLETAIKELPSGIYSVKKMRTRICRKNFPDYDWKDSRILRKIGSNLGNVLSRMIDQKEVRIYNSGGVGRHITYQLRTDLYLNEKRDIESH